MFRKGILAFVVLLAFTMGVSAATVDVADANAYSSDGTASLTYTLVQTNAATAQNCTLYDNIDGSWGVSVYASVDVSLTNGSNVFGISPPFTDFSNEDTALFNVLCADNASTTAKDATNGTVTFMMYKNLYSTTDLNEMTVDILGTGVNASIQWVDLLVLLAIVGVGLSIIAGIVFKGGRIFGLG